MVDTTSLPDKIKPIHDPNREFSHWRIEQIYTAGEHGNGRWVPNVGDIVIDTSVGHGGYKLMEVQFVDETTLLSTMVELQNASTNNFSKENQLLGVGPGYQSETWRLFLDQSVTPHVFLPDSRLTFKGTENTRYKIFKGTDTSQITGKVISMNFNSNGELLSEDIPLEKVAFPAGHETDTNLAVKACRKGYTTEKLNNGEVVTLVAYNDSGIPTSYNVLLVHNTALDHAVESSKRYITTIGIDSPFLDKTENNTLVFPMNMPRDALAMMGVVSYSDGTSKRVPITLGQQGRMRLVGLDNYIPMKNDQNINLALIYNMTQDEMALNASVGDNRFIAVKYFGRTTKVDGSYSVNLFPVPTYVSDNAGWKIRYMLYTLERDVVYDVTDLVQAGVGSEPFKPLSYGDTQDLTVVLDLERVDPRMKKFRHVQSFKLALMGRPDPGLETPWYLTYEKDQNPVYGKNILCKAVRDPGLNKWRLDLSCGSKTLDGWLERVYYRTMPLVNRYLETRPPKPTHFTLVIDDQRKTYPIAAWNTVIDFPIGSHDGYGTMLQFSKVDGVNNYQLATAPMCFMDLSESGVVDHAGSQQPGNSNGSTDPNANNGTASTLIDIDAEVRKVADRGASPAVQDKYRQMLERIKRYQLLRYEDINRLYQRIRNVDMTPASIANDVILLELEVNKISISDFNRDTRTSGYAPPNMNV